jgi:hypothetical protein
MKTKPMTMLLMMIAGWMNREQQEIIEYLQAENGIFISPYSCSRNALALGALISNTGQFGVPVPPTSV